MRDAGETRSNAVADPLAREKAFLLKNVAELSARYPGRYLLIKGEQVHGAFEALDEGIEAGARRFGAGPCLIRSVLQPEDPPPITIPVLSLGLPLLADPRQSLRATELCSTS